MLGNCHIHAVLDGVWYKDAIAAHSGPLGPDESIIRTMLSSYHDIGVEYLRDGGDRWGACMLARRLASEYGIEYAAPSFPIHKNGSYGGFIGRGYDDLREFEALVDEAVSLGCDFIKVMVSGILDFDVFGRVTTGPTDPDEMRKIAELAHARGLSVMAHCNGARTVQAAVEAGIDSIEHGFYLDEESRACLAESDSVWVPTIAPVSNLLGTGRYDEAVVSAIVDAHLSDIADVAARGGLVALGDDAGAWAVPHGRGTLDELGYLQKALGETCDDVLVRGLDAVRAKFPGAKCDN